MNTTDLILGIDVSKDLLDSYQLVENGKGCKRRIKNSIKSINKFLEAYDPQKTFVVFEPTGTYSDKLLTCLEEKKFKFSLVNPVYSHHFALAQGITVKNDQQAAKTLAQMGLSHNLPVYKPQSQQNKDRKHILQAINTLEQEKRAFSSRIHALEKVAKPVKSIIESYKRIINILKEEIKSLSKQIRLIKDDTHKHNKLLAETVRGIGPKTSQWLLTITNGFENFYNDKQVIKFLGLAPRSHQSGSSVYTKSGITKRGKTKVRACLYMAGLSALKSNKACRELYDRLRKRKPHYKAMIAVMVKLVKQVFAVVKSGLQFDNEYHLKFQKI